MQTNPDSRAIRKFLLKDEIPSDKLFDYKFRITAQKLGRYGRPIVGSATQFHNLKTLVGELSEKMGEGRYNLWIKFRKPFESKWGLVKINHFEIEFSFRGHELDYFRKDRRWH